MANTAVSGFQPKEDINGFCKVNKHFRSEKQGHEKWISSVKLKRSPLKVPGNASVPPSFGGRGGTIDMNYRFPSHTVEEREACR